MLSSLSQFSFHFETTGKPMTILLFIILYYAKIINYYCFVFYNRLEFIMIFFLLLFLLITLKSINICTNENHFNTNYLSIENTNVIKGIFVILVIFSHSSQYITLDSVYDNPYSSFMKFMGQMIVSVFLFYSGYGIMESLKKKKFSYIKTIPTKRFLKVLINFDIAVLLYLVLNLILGTHYDIKTTILSFIGWENIGNSNWYILAVLVLYILTFISFFPMKWWNDSKSLYIYAAFFTILSIGFVYFEMKMGKQSYYYNTIILYALGIWYSLLKKYIENITFKNDVIYSAISALLLLLLYLSYDNRASFGIESYSLWAVCFTITLILFSMKISFNNTILSWFGTHIFSVYILQRIPMMILHYFGVTQNHKYFFIVLSIIATICLAHIFDNLTGKMWKRIAS